ncbi:MAG TPA: hypothetical protein VKA48_04905, partial [Gammaproteobacteria bacterium]|nr:hypothetical protein [Gammaproteobacteria bacterium]
RPREHYLLGRFLGIAMLLAGTMALFGLFLGLLGWVASSGYQQGTPIHNGWPLAPVMAYLWLDLITVTAFTCLMGTLSTTPMLPFGLGLAFAWAARTFGPVLAYMYGGDRPLGGTGTPLGEGLRNLQWLLPDLSQLDLREGLLYGQWPTGDALTAAPAAALGYTTLLLGLAIWRFRSREFA